MQFNDILDKQRAYFRKGATLDPAFRVAQLRKLLDLINAEEQGFYSAIQSDFDKSPFETFVSELGFLKKELKYFIKNIPRLARGIKVPTDIYNLPGSSRRVPDPYGQVLIIGVWNYPFLLALGPLVTALAAGNTVFVKLSEVAPACSAWMARLLNDNFPPELVKAIEGDSAVATELLKLRYDKIFFTGSPRVGKIVYEAAAKHLTPVTLELGGKSPAIIMPSADLRIAARRIVWGKFFNGGQTCIAPDFILVHEQVKMKFLDLLISEIESNNYQPGSTHYTRIINKAHFERIKKLIAPDKVIFGGESDQAELFMAPVVMDHVTWDDAVMQEEIFGPVLPVLTFNDLPGVIERLNDTEKPLAAYLFTTAADDKAYFLRHYSFGGGCINDILIHFTSTNLPFGGVGNSGTGYYHGKSGFESFSHYKSVLFRKNWGEPNWKYPPYSSRKLNLLKWILGVR